MSVFKKYPSIEKIKDVMKSVSKKNKRTFSHLEIDKETGNKTPIFFNEVLPKLKFLGTVKLHGSNGCIIINNDLSTDFQSRNRILSLTSDNAGFCLFGNSHVEEILEMFQLLTEDNTSDYIHIYGEWCGGNIQSNVALSGIPKTFIIFGILITTFNDDEIWLPMDIVKEFTNKNDIRNIFEFKTYEVEIDFNDVTKGLEIIDKLRDEIDEVCPVAKSLGSTSEITCGEGNVWRCVMNGYESLSFKHKGNNHQRKGKNPKSQSPKLIMNEEQQLAFQSFLIDAVTVDRLAQCIEFLEENNLEIHRKNTGHYLKWFISDIEKECKESIIILSKVDISWKDVYKPISAMAREFYFDLIDNQ